METEIKKSSNNIAVLGAGSWGLTLAVLLHQNKFNVSVWEFNAVQADYLREKRKLSFLPDLKIPADLFITNNIQEALNAARLVVFAVPSQTIRNTARMLSGTHFSDDTIIVNAAKGLELDTLMRLSEVLKHELPKNIRDRIVVLSGPSHAEEVCKKLSTTVVAASQNEELARIVQNVFSTEYFRIYTNTDVAGVELGGALKNVIAIAVGIGDGMGMGDNSKAALITRGSFEIMRLGIFLGAHTLTFAGLSGIGDLVVTCISRNSRNRNFGEKIGQGKTIDQALSEISMTVEGVHTAKAARELAKKYNIQMPITEQVYQVLFCGKNPLAAEKDLMNRDMKAE